MQSTCQTNPAWRAAPLRLRSLARAQATARALLILTKPRLALLSLITAMAAFAAAMQQPSFVTILATCLGAALSAGGALSFNHWIERRSDALMTRTRRRPLPSGQLTPGLALAWSLSLSISGVGLLFWLTTATAAAISAAIIVLYAGIYTPLKRRTRWATEIGALSGALPPILGTAAAGQVLHPAGLTLATVLLFWQMPHFYAIGWRYRQDYRAAGFPLLPAIDSDGQRTARWSMGYSYALVAASLLPWIFGWLGWPYAFGSLAVGYWILFKAWRFLSARDVETRDLAARQLFLASLVHITVLSIALAIDRLF